MSQGVYIGDEPGLGKTIQAIGCINAVPEIKRALIVTKASLKENWRRELEKWLIRPMEIGIATGQHWPRRASCVIINYDVLTKHMNALRAEPWDLVVLDESHNIKNRDAKRTVAVIGRVPSKKAQAAGEPIIPPIPAKRRLALSGTPIENRPEELWTTLHFLAPDRWPSFFGYARRYCGMVNNGFGMSCSGPTNVEELQRVLRSTVMIRRLKSDVLTELPAKTRMIIEMDTDGLAGVIERDQQSYAQYASFLEDAQVELEIARADDNPLKYKEAVKALQGGEYSFAELAKIRRDTAISKVPGLISLLTEELDECQKMLVFGHHREVLRPLYKAFPGSVIITGETPADQRQSICDRFQNDPECRMFFGSIRACGEGLTLTAANLVCFVEEDWTPGKMSQAEDRAHRIGQKDNVLVKHFILPGTLEASMVRINVEKQESIEASLDVDPGDWATQPAFTAFRPLGRRKEILAEGLLMLSREIQAVQTNLQALANVPELHRLDRRIAERLLELEMTGARAALGRRLCEKYGRALGLAAVQAMRVDTAEEEDQIPMAWA